MAVGKGGYNESTRDPLEWTDHERGARPETHRGPGVRFCEAHKSDGSQCKAFAVKGSTKCHHHGNGSQPAFEANMRRQTVAAADYLATTYGRPVEIEPAEALLAEVHRTAGHIAWLGEKIAQSDPAKFADEIWYYRKAVDSKAVYTTNQIQAMGPAFAGVWTDLYMKERAHLVKVCEAALRAGVEERLVKVAERQADQIGLAISQMLRELGLDPTDSRVRDIAFRALQLASGEVEYVEGTVVR